MLSGLFLGYAVIHLLIWLWGWRLWAETGRPTALDSTEYLLLSKRTVQVFDTDAGMQWKPSKRPA